MARSDSQEAVAKMWGDWNWIDKNDYLNAMQNSFIDTADIKRLIQAALTDKINDRETFIKGIDYPYYY